MAWKNHLMIFIIVLSYPGTILTQTSNEEVSTPHAPHNLSVTTTEFAAKVSWLPAYDGGYPQHYVLWYKRKIDSQSGGSDQWQTLRVVPDEATSITVYNLLPEFNYEFTVLSRNRLGDGLFSKIVTARTKGVFSKWHANDARDEGSKTDPTQPGIPPKSGSELTTPERGPVPPRPTNVTIMQQRFGLKISWLFNREESQVPITQFRIEFRTVGQWVQLSTESAERTWFLWETASRGATYHFRVVAISEHTESLPSKPETFSTKDPRQEGMRVSDGMIGGIVGGLLFLFLAIILAVLAVKIFNKRRQREKAMRYGNVKYFGPKHMDTNKSKGNSSNPGQSYVVAEVDAIPITENHCSTPSPQTHAKQVKETPI